MSRQRGKAVHGVVLLDKPAGVTSNQALQKVRRLFEARKAGHTGSLDPFATGMLPICLGEACKTAAFMLNADKAYRATARLGVATATGDIEGEVVEDRSVPELDPTSVRQALAAFVGNIEQVPPMHSALKHQGKPLYAWARQGVRVERQPRAVRIDSLELIALRGALLEFEVRCSKGTYVRTLAEDIAARLGTCAHLVALRRLWVRPFERQPMATLDALEAAAGQGTLMGCLLPPDAGLADWPEVRLDAGGARAFGHGNPVSLTDVGPGWVRVRDAGGELLGLGEVRPGGGLQPRRLFVWE